MAKENPSFTLRIGGALTLAVVTVFAAGAEQRSAALRRELIGEHAVSSAASIGRLAWVPSEPDREAALLDLSLRLQEYGKQDPRLSRVSVLEASEAPDTVVLLAEWSRASPARTSGTRLDVKGRPSLLRGFWEPTVMSSADSLSAYFPVPDRGESNPALVAVELDISDLSLHEARADRSTISILLLAGVGFGLVGFGLRKRGQSPEKTAIAVANADPEGPTPPVPEPREAVPEPPKNPHDVRVQDLERIQKEREFIREAFGRYVSLRMAGSAGGNLDVEPGGDERSVSILSVNLPGLVPIDGAAPAQEVVALANDVLAASNEVIDGHGGFIVDFSATRFVAVFGAPVRLPDHAERAVRCAVALRRRLQATVGDWQRAHRPWLPAEFSFQAGIAAGRVVAGAVGWQARCKYAVVGEPVDVAERLALLNVELETEILLSDAVLEGLPEGQIQSREQGTRELGTRVTRVHSIH